MYKVFIDHKPILFVNRLELNHEFSSVESNVISDILIDITEKMKLVSLDHPLQIICQDAELEFQRLFSNFKNIEAAGGIVESKKGILMIFRNGIWDIPKGKIEKGDALIDSKNVNRVAAVREVEEECGIRNPKITDFLIETLHTYEYKSKNILKKTYWYLMDYDGEEVLIPQIDEGITDVKWMSFEELMKIRGNTYGSINEVIDAYRTHKA